MILQASASATRGKIIGNRQPQPFEGNLCGKKKNPDGWKDIKPGRNLLGLCCARYIYGRADVFFQGLYLSHGHQISFVFPLSFFF
jgi:hypothetical protein